MTRAQTSLSRALVALILAPGILAIPLFLLTLVTGTGSGETSQDVWSVAALAILILIPLESASLILGGAIWIALRTLSWESDFAYVVAGMVGGATWFALQIPQQGMLTQDEFWASLVLALGVGASLSWCFWRIARVSAAAPARGQE